jgi:hypothetical protein
MGLAKIKKAHRENDALRHIIIKFYLFSWSSKIIPDSPLCGEGMVGT